MAKVFFGDKFYEAPEGSTSLEYCADCKIAHSTCDGCPWKFVDMSKAVEIDAVKKEECLNYVAPAQGGKFYYSRNLVGGLSFNARRPLVYCEGTDVGGWAKIACSIDNYAAGFIADVKALRNIHCTNCQDKQDCIKCGNYDDLEAFSYCIYMEYHTGITYNNVHFDKEIPKDIWDSCVSLIREFNKIAYDMIMQNATSLANSAEWKKEVFLFNDDKRFPYHNITDSIYYTVGNVHETDFYGGSYYIQTIDFDSYSCYGKESRVETQLHSNEKPSLYVIPETIVNKIVVLQKEMDSKIEKLVAPYVK